MRGSGGFGAPLPGQQLIDPAVRPEIDEPCQDAGQVGLRIDAMEPVDLDEAGDNSPVLGSVIIACEEVVLRRGGS
jgi:hypothetical protein